MLQSILILCGIVAVLIFVLDIRRRARGHTKAVLKERNAIAEMTHSTAVVSNFSDGGATEILLAASEDSGLFFYRRIDKGTLVLHYTLRLNKLGSVVLQIDGDKASFSFDSSNLTAQMRATDVARQARQTYSSGDLEKIKNIRLNIFFRSEDGTEKNIPVTMYRASSRVGADSLAKIFENAVWWQHYLTLLSQRKSEIDTLNFNDN